MRLQLPPKGRNVFGFVKCVWQPVPESGRSFAEWACPWVLFVCVPIETGDG